MDLKELVGKSPSTIGEIQWWSAGIPAQFAVNGDKLVVVLTKPEDVAAVALGDTVLVVSPDYVEVATLELHPTKDVPEGSFSIQRAGENYGQQGGHIYRARQWQVFSGEALPTAETLALYKLRNVEREAHRIKIENAANEAAVNEMQTRAKLKVLSVLKERPERQAIDGLLSEWSKLKPGSTGLEIDKNYRREALAALAASSIAEFRSVGEMLGKALKTNVIPAVDMIPLDNLIAAEYLGLDRDTEAMTADEKGAHDAEIADKVRAFVNTSLADLEAIQLARLDQQAQGYDDSAEMVKFNAREIEMLCRMPAGQMSVMDGHGAYGREWVNKIYTAIVQMEMAALQAEVADDVPGGNETAPIA